MRQVTCPVLVGRAEETAFLRAAVAAAGDGRGGTVLVTGEPGIGKSRLVREAADMARGRDMAVLAGRAVAGGIPTPFRPFAEALAPVGRPGRLPDGADLDAFRPALGRLIPQWRPQAPGDDSLVFLGEAVLQLLRVLSPEGGCLLVPEDMHWADRETLALLEYLFRLRFAWFVLSYLLGHDNVRVHDGSWAEWGRLADVPVAQGQ